MKNPVDLIRINHYMYKSEEDLILRAKKKKADRFITDEEQKNIIDNLFNKKDDYNAIEDNIMLRYVDRVKEGLKSMGI